MIDHEYDETETGMIYEETELGAEQVVDCDLSWRSGRRIVELGL